MGWMADMAYESVVKAIQEKINEVTKSTDLDDFQKEHVIKGLEMAKEIADKY